MKALRTDVTDRPQTRAAPAGVVTCSELSGLADALREAAAGDATGVVVVDGRGERETARFAAALLSGARASQQRAGARRSAR